MDHQGQILLRDIAEWNILRSFAGVNYYEEKSLRAPEKVSIGVQDRDVHDGPAGSLFPHDRLDTGGVSGLLEFLVYCHVIFYTRI